MVTVNKNYLKLPGSYLFSTIAKKVAAYQEANPDVQIVRLGIGDVTQPLAPAIINALHKSVDEMANAETFQTYLFPEFPDCHPNLLSADIHCAGRTGKQNHLPAAEHIARILYPSRALDLPASRRSLL